MSFKEYVREMEELAVQEVEQTKKQKVADLIRTMEDLNNEKFHAFAVDELGMEETEAEALVYKMLRDYLLAGDAQEPEMGGLDALGDIGGEEPIGIEVELGDELGGDELPVDPELEEVPAEDEEEDEALADLA